MSLIVCSMVIMNDPQDRYGANAYLNSRETYEDSSVKGSLGYQNALKREREKNPELYDA